MYRLCFQFQRKSDCLGFLRQTGAELKFITAACGGPSAMMDGQEKTPMLSVNNLDIAGLALSTYPLPTGKDRVTSGCPMSAARETKHTSMTALLMVGERHLVGTPRTSVLVAMV